MDFDRLALGLRWPFFISSTTSRSTPAGRAMRLVQPPRVLTRGQSQEQPRLNHTPNNDVGTDT